MKIMDSGLNQLLMMPYSMFLTAGYEKETSDGYEKSTQVAGHPGWEKWDTSSKRGEVNAAGREAVPRPDRRRRDRRHEAAARGRRQDRPLQARRHGQVGRAAPPMASLPRSESPREARRRCRCARSTGTVVACRRHRRPPGSRTHGTAARPRRPPRGQPARHALGRHGAQRHDRDQSAAGVGRRPRVLQEGGNAIDAAVTAAAVLAVVEPTMNGLGGDLFALVYDREHAAVKGLNASGRAPAGATPAAFTARSSTTSRARHSVGSGAGRGRRLGELLARHGTISLARALAPAIEYARAGFAVSRDHRRRSGAKPSRCSRAIRRRPRCSCPAATRRGPATSSPTRSWRRPRRDCRRRTRRVLQGTDRRGDWRRRERREGLLRAADLAAHRSDWVEPISTSYRGHELYELPPNTQGFVALEMLNLLEGFDLKALGHNSAAYLHLLIEAKRIAFADRDAYLADLDSRAGRRIEAAPLEGYAARPRKEIDPDRAARSYAPAGARHSARPPDRPRAARRGARRHDLPDRRRQERQRHLADPVDLRQLRSRASPPETPGFVLHNRGSLFSLTAGHPNRIAPGKRPLHTLVPAMVMKDGNVWLSFGVMGGDMQPQGHVQALVNLVDFGMNVQEAGEAARIRHTAGTVAAETGLSAERASASRRAATVWSRRRHVRRLSGHPVRSAHRRDDGRLGSSQGRARHRLVTQTSDLQHPPQSPLPRAIVDEPRGGDVLDGHAQRLEDRDFVGAPPAVDAAAHQFAELAGDVAAVNRPSRDRHDDVAGLDQRGGPRIDEHPRARDERRSASRADRAGTRRPP